MRNLTRAVGGVLAKGCHARYARGSASAIRDLLPARYAHPGSRHGDDWLLLARAGTPFCAPLCERNLGSCNDGSKAARVWFPTTSSLMSGILGQPWAMRSNVYNIARVGKPFISSFSRELLTKQVCATIGTRYRALHSPIFPTCMRRISEASPY